ncbi:MAG: PHP domain-containing protein [Candidatus Hydrogenedentes bacterium]|nr:PHP domain-containing protein [Candidatus Hydrogenedentota bacterium]
MKPFSADLHIHTALSPCADDNMTPPAIIKAAIKAGLQIIAICDHNSAGNAPAVIAAAKDELIVIPGIEITTSEEAHILGLFETTQAAAAVSDLILASLPNSFAGKPRGRQIVMNERGGPIRLEPHRLFLSSQYSVSGAVDLIHGHGGIAIASHVDRPSFSVLSQLGFLPPDVLFDAIEVSPAAHRAGRSSAYEATGYPVVVSSDSHFLTEIGCCRTFFSMDVCSFPGLKQAIHDRQQLILKG